MGKGRGREPGSTGRGAGKPDFSQRGVGVKAGGERGEQEEHPMQLKFEQNHFQQAVVE